jgi:protein-tyrosine phosphatase
MSEMPPLVDIHNHLIPEVDDGARSLDESLAALSAMRDQGVRRLVCTPHIDAETINREDRFAARMLVVDAAWERFASAARERFPDVDVHRGHEVMVDTPRFSLADSRIRIAGGPYVLVEFPRLFVPAGSEDVLYHLRLEGYSPVVAHPERYVGSGSVDLETIAQWRQVGGAMIVNAGSLAGGFGREAHRTALELLRLGWIDMIGSDYHARPNRPLLLRQAYAQLSDWGGEEQARVLLSENPARVIDGQPLLPVESLDGAGRWWQRLRRIFAS